MLDCSYPGFSIAGFRQDLGKGTFSQGISILFKLYGGAFSMDNWTFGITMMVCGMGGTILTLYVMSLIMTLLGKLFPYKKEEA